MALFQYRGRDGDGSAVSGTLTAANRDAVIERLLGEGVTVVDIVERSNTVSEPAGSLVLWRPVRRPRSDELALFVRQFHALDRAGVPLVQALTGLADSSRERGFAEAIERVRGELESGHPLSAALARQQRIFPPVFVNMVRIGEATGHMGHVLERLAVYLERDRDTRQRVSSAIRYPLFVIAAIIVAMVVINVFVIPQFGAVFAGADVALPFTTRMLLASSAFVLSSWPLMVFAAVLAAILVRARLRTPRGRYTWDRCQLHAPLVGRIFRKSEMARFNRALSMSLEAGVPLIEALRVVASATRNRWLAACIDRMTRAIERGDTLTGSAMKSGLFTALEIQMLAVGEEADALSELTREIADYHDRELDHDIKHLAETVEPVLVVCLAGLVLILALGVFLPMWDLATVKFLG